MRRRRAYAFPDLGRTMIDSTCPNCHHRVTFSYFRLFILPRLGRHVHRQRPTPMCRSRSATTAVTG